METRDPNLDKAKAINPLKGIGEKPAAELPVGESIEHADKVEKQLPAEAPPVVTPEAPAPDETLEETKIDSPVDAVVTPEAPAQSAE